MGCTGEGVVGCVERSWGGCVGCMRRVAGVWGRFEGRACGVRSKCVWGACEGCVWRLRGVWRVCVEGVAFGGCGSSTAATREEAALLLLLLLLQQQLLLVLVQY